MLCEVQRVAGPAMLLEIARGADQMAGHPTEPSRDKRGEARDGAAITDAAVVRVTAIKDSEVVMVDAP